MIHVVSAVGAVLACLVVTSTSLKHQALQSETSDAVPTNQKILMLIGTHSPTETMLTRWSAIQEDLEKNLPGSVLAVTVDLSDQGRARVGRKRIRRIANAVPRAPILSWKWKELEEKFPHLRFNDTGNGTGAQTVVRRGLNGIFFHAEPFTAAFEDLERDHDVKLEDFAHVWLVQDDVAFCPDFSSFVRYHERDKADMLTPQFITEHRDVLRQQNPTPKFLKRFEKYKTTGKGWMRTAEQLMRLSVRFVRQVQGLVHDGISAESEFLWPQIADDTEDNKGKFSKGRFHHEAIIGYNLYHNITKGFLHELCQTNKWNDCDADGRKRAAESGQGFQKAMISAYHNVKF